MPFWDDHIVIGYELALEHIVLYAVRDNEHRFVFEDDMGFCFVFVTERTARKLFVTLVKLGIPPYGLSEMAHRESSVGFIYNFTKETPAWRQGL